MKLQRINIFKKKQSKKKTGWHFLHLVSVSLSSSFPLTKGEKQRSVICGVLGMLKAEPCIPDLGPSPLTPTPADAIYSSVHFLS